MVTVYDYLKLEDKTKELWNMFDEEDKRIIDTIYMLNRFEAVLCHNGEPVPNVDRQVAEILLEDIKKCRDMMYNKAKEKEIGSVRDEEEEGGYENGNFKGGS